MAAGEKEAVSTGACDVSAKSVREVASAGAQDAVAKGARDAAIKGAREVASAGAHNTDTPQVARRRAREMRTVSQMIALYCKGNHDASVRTHTAFCGESVCEDCKNIDDYAHLRTERCKKMDVKTSCNECENHCYKPDEQKRIRAIMRYSGPRMLSVHPIAAIRHLLGR